MNQETEGRRRFLGITEPKAADLKEALFILLTVVACAFLAAAAVFLLIVIASLLTLDGMGIVALAFGLGIAAGVLAAAITRIRLAKRTQHANSDVNAAIEELRAVTREVAETNQRLSGAEATGVTPAHASSPNTETTSNDTDSSPRRFSALDLGELTECLVHADDPVAELRAIEEDIASREQAWKGRGLWSGGRQQAERARRAARAMGKPDPELPEGPDPDPEQTPIPSGLELFLAHRLRETAIVNGEVELPRLHIVRPHRSGMFYLRVEQPKVAYLSMVEVIRIEAALNAVRFCLRYFDDPSSVSERDCICLMQRLTSSIAAQAEPIDKAPEVPEGVDPEGEWAVRHAISHAIESFQLPYRLTASYRTNVADGNVAIEVAITPESVFPRVYYPTGYPTAKPLESTRTSRRQLASGYALRLAVLLAATAFRTTPKVKHVWVAGIMETATRHDCYYSIDFDRWRFAKLDLEDLGDLERALHPFCPVMRLEDGFLRPVQQTFSLGEERFCPRRRYESVSLSSRRLEEPLARALGTDHVSGLAIAESEKREAVVGDILRHWADPSGIHATETNVHTILEMAGDDPDPSVRSAAERTALALAQGTVAEDPFAVAEEFVAGDELSRACRDAGIALHAHDAERAWDALEGPLEHVRATGIYEDSLTVEWRFFADFVDRTLYNRLYADPERSLMLVPESYFEALSLAVTLLLMQDRNEAAVAAAQELVRIAPLDTRSHLQLVRAYENNEQLEEASDQLATFLQVAHDPQSVGTAYYRMAFFQWQQGNALAAKACYTAALHFIPVAAPQVAMELATLAFQSQGTDISDLERELSQDEVIEVLQELGIPEAPTDEISDTFAECARASVDAEIFPVARNFLSTMAAFAPDDVIVGLMRSLEDAPDSL